MGWLNSKEHIIENSVVIDKVVGKASALLLTYGKARYVFGKTMSKTADEILTRYGIPHDCDKFVDFIENTDRTDMCPMEKKVVDIDDPETAYITFRNSFAAK